MTLANPWAVRLELDGEARIRHAGGDVAGILGLAEHAAVGRSIAHLVTPAPPARFDELWAAVLDPLCNRLLTLAYVTTAEGAQRPVELRFRRELEGARVGAVVADVAVLAPGLPADEPPAVIGWLSPDPLAVLGRDGMIRFANPALERLLGVGPGALRDVDVREVGLSGDALATITADFGRAVTGQQVVSEVRFAGRHFQHVFLPVAGADGVVRDVVSHSHDVTAYSDRIARLEAQARALRQQLDDRAGEALGEATSGHVGHGRALVAFDGTILRASEALGDLAGCACTELTGTDIAALFDPDDVEVLQAHARRLRTGDIDVLAFTGRFGRTDKMDVVGTVAGVRRDGEVVAVALSLARADRAVLPMGDASREQAVLRNRLAQLERALLRFQGVLEEVSPSRRAPEPAQWWVESSPLDVLSARELEIVQLLADGMRPPSIARQLHLSASTIRNHLSGIYRKLGVASQEELLLSLRGMAG